MSSSQSAPKKVNYNPIRRQLIVHEKISSRVFEHSCQSGRNWQTLPTSENNFPLQTWLSGISRRRKKIIRRSVNRQAKPERKSEKIEFHLVWGKLMKWSSQSINYNGQVLKEEKFSASKLIHDSWWRAMILIGVALRDFLKELLIKIKSTRDTRRGKFWK